MGYQKHRRFWKNRKIDWKKSYFNTGHPHRGVLLRVLGKFQFQSLLEVGCGAGANLANIQANFNTQVGGVDINPDAIKEAKKELPNAYQLSVGEATALFFSDKSVDVILTDMCLIYLDNKAIKKAMKEIARVARNGVIFCEFHSHSWWKRLLLRLSSGYFAHNYKKRMEALGYYDICFYKITDEMWPGGEPQKTFGYIITGRI